MENYRLDNKVIFYGWDIFISFISNFFFSELWKINGFLKKRNEAHGGLCIEKELSLV